MKKNKLNDIFCCYDTINFNSKQFGIFNLKKIKRKSQNKITALPVSYKILLENLLRNFDGKVIKKIDVENLINRKVGKEIQFKPSRVLMQDYTGVPAVADLAAMRDKVKEKKKDPKIINPSVPVSLVIDHSISVDSYGSKLSMNENVFNEFNRNQERYKLLKWAQLSFENFKVQISLRDKDDNSKYMGDEKLWDKAEKELIESVKVKGIDAVVEYGEAAFYGPKIDFMVRDSLEREWQLGTIQVDYQLPQRFNLTYVDKNNKKKNPVLIHRAPFGSLERFIAILIEHCEGNFPLWLAPEQTIILPINENVIQYAEKINATLIDNGFRSSVDKRNEKISKKVRDAELKKIPYMLIVGDKEMESNSVSVRKKTEGDIGQKVVKDFIMGIQEELSNATN